MKRLFSLCVLFFCVVNSRVALSDDTSPLSFAQDARAIVRVAACTGDDPLPEGIDAQSVADHCKKMVSMMDRYKKNYVVDAKTFLTAIRPSEPPSTVVYPFGGGDLVSALTTYPNAKEITTLSLELAGDPRRLRKKISIQKLAETLTLLRRTIAGLLLYNDSTSVNLSKMQQGELPGQVTFFLVGLAVHGFEPVEMRYFDLTADGSVHYLSEADVASDDADKARKLKSNWTSPDFSPAFSNVEITFRPVGSTDEGDLRVHRHFGYNLSNDSFTKGSPLFLHLDKKGTVAAMTKAASYLLWRDNFSTIRDYLLSHMVYMVSDSTGVPPSYAKAAGFEQTPYGTFSGSFLGANPKFNADFRSLFAQSPKKELPFRYGYIDASKRYHMVVTKKL